MNSGTAPGRFRQRPIRLRITPRPPDKTSKPRVGSRDGADGFCGIKVIVGLLIL
jgi:hypothetical protein